MLPRHYSSEGVILATRHFSEADRLIVIFSRGYGKVTVIAKGVRKPKSKKGRNVEVFNIIKFAAARGKSLDILTEVELLDAHKKVRKDLKRTSVAYYFIETTGRITQDEEKNLEFYNLSVDYLTRLETSKNLKKTRHAFIYDTLVLLGFWPSGKKMENHDVVLENVLEKKLSSKRVGKKILE